LLAEAADGYKRLIMDLLPQTDTGSRASALRDAMLRCIEYITQQALQAHAIYQAVPTHIWRDLHKLYAYAEQHRFDGDASGPRENSIRSAYVRVLLLSIANPHHLLLGEIYQTSDLLKKWALSVRLQQPATTEAVYGRFFCDLDSNAPAVFGVKGITMEPAEPRLLDLNEVLAIIKDRMKVLALQHKRSLQLRSEWDLLLRLRTAWETRKLRGETRQPERGITVKAIVGLSSCHCFFSSYTPFEPEQTEIELHGSAFKTETTLSLVPSDETPWVDADVKSKLKSGVIKPRAYGFDLENRENDIWTKAHSSGQRFDTELEKRVEDRSLGQILKFSLANTSVGGVGMETPPDSPAHLRVGEIVAAFPQGDSEDGDPVLNTVRWMHCDHNRKLYIGLRHIDGELAPVALRSLEEEAHFRSYARGFIMKDDSGAVTVIVPAGLFGSGNVVLVNHSDRLEILQIKSLVQNTRAFAQFTCQPLQADAQLSEYIIFSLKKLLRENTS
jgi:hypothetical protein